MKQTILLILMSLSFSAFCQIDYRQSSEKAYVYQLTDAQALELVKIDFDGYLEDLRAFKDFGKPIDSISIGGKFVIPDYALGHYIIVRVVGEKVEYKFISEYDIGLVPVYDKHKMRFHLIDSLGNFIEADKVTLDGKKMKYRADKQYYEHKRFRNERLLIIEKGEKLVFYEIERDDYDNWFVRQWEKIVDWNIWHSPLYSAWRAMRNGWRNFTYLFRPVKRATYGYITTNKPKYLPNDTVKIKAYLTTQNGRPYNQELTLKIVSYGVFNFEKTIEPTTKGSYIFEFPLGDSLRLDRQYQVQIWKGKKVLMSTYFNYEDYQLDEISYDFRSEKTDFKRYEPIVFYASGKNANGQNVLDGEVEILASSGNASAYHAKKVLIPDTLFYYKGALQVNDLATNEMRFVIPKETIPMADFGVSVRAIFTNANGELITKNLTLGIISDSTYLDMRMEADTLVVDYLVNGKSTAAVGILDLELAETDFYIQKTIQLPYKEQINPVFEKVKVRVEKEYKELNFNYSNSELEAPSFSLIQTADSVFVFGYNPSGLVVHYDIYRINRKVEKGSSSEKLIVWKDKIRSKKSYRIEYEYIINSKNERKSQYFDYAKNQLTIDIEQPNKIQPGETVDVKIKVKSSKNRAAKNVNLVAGAVNTQFKNTDNWKFNAPFLGKRSKRKKVTYNNYYDERINEYIFYGYDVFDWKDTINQKNRNDFELDKHLYYQLLFADNGYFEKSINVKSDTLFAQFAPFIVKENQFQPVYLVYANRRLLYYHDAVSPYSFQGRVGYNTVSIRGIDFEIQIDSVFLKAGEKLVFSIDLDNLPENAKRYSRTKEWTNSEKALLRKSIFTYQNRSGLSQVYVWQNSVVYPYSSTELITNFGPFEPNQNINLIKKNAFQTRFKFEPYFIYEVEENRERLYYTDAFPANQTINLPKQTARMSLNDTLFFNKNIPVFAPKRYKPLIQQQLEKALKNIQYSKNNNPNYKVVINNTSEAIDTTHFAFIFINQQNNKKYFYKGNSNSFGGLVKGNYKMYAYTIWGNYVEHEIEIKNDTLTYEYLDFLTYQSDEKLLNFLTIMNLKEIKIDTNKQIIGNNGKRRNKEQLQLNDDTYLISGTIKDEQGDVVIGATVTVTDKDKVYGTVTNLDGYYELVLPNNLKKPKLEVHYLGYTSIEMRLTETENNIVLSDNQEVLDEVIIVGYGVAEKKKTTSMSVQSLSVKEIQRIPSRDVSALLGQVAGVSSKNKAKILVRGNAALDESYKFPKDTLNLNQLSENSKIRSRFQDYAFWQPNLITDKNGEATFRVTYPDDITAYKTFVLGMDKRRRFGIATKTVKSQKTALAQLAVPRFLIQGDEVNVIGKSLNYSADSLRIKSTFLLENEVLKTNDFWLNGAEIETANLKVNTDKDTLQLTYKMEHEKFFDGEKRPIPIYRKGVEETVGSFNILTGDTTVTLTFDKEKGKVKIYAQTDILEVLLKDVDYLINYQYGCNEQTASRLMALLMNMKIRKITDVNYENSKADLKNKQTISKMMKRLEEAQNDDGSWGWWRGNQKNFWMTNYVLKALHAAPDSYRDKAITTAYETGLRFITNALSEMKGVNLLNAVELLSDLQQNMDYKKYVAALDTQIVKRDIYNQLILTKVKQQQSLPYNLNLLDSLEKRTLFGNLFYDIDRSKNRWHYGYRYWYTNNYNLTTLAYQILRNEGGNENKLAAIRGYFLEKRTNYGWRNTFTTAQILSTILPDIANVSNRVKPQLVIKGNTTETVTKFPFETTFYANTPLEIQKTGTSTVYLTGYQQFWNEEPKAKSDVFELSSKLVQEGKTVKKLTAKRPAKMVVTLEVKAEAEYVMVEVPIPAGCSYGDKIRNYSWYGREVYREYFREKTAIFYKNLPVGTYTIEINLEPRFTGEYTVNPAKAEQMYFPVFYGRNEMKAVEIAE